MALENRSSKTFEKNFCLYFSNLDMRVFKLFLLKEQKFLKTHFDSYFLKLILLSRCLNTVSKSKSSYSNNDSDNTPHLSTHVRILIAFAIYRTLLKLNEHWCFAGHMTLVTRIIRLCSLYLVWFHIFKTNHLPIVYE